MSRQLRHYRELCSAQMTPPLFHPGVLQCPAWRNACGFSHLRQLTWVGLPFNTKGHAPICQTPLILHLWTTITRASADVANVIAAPAVRPRHAKAAMIVFISLAFIQRLLARNRPARKEAGLRKEFDLRILPAAGTNRCR
jgi:hypothetical protein